MASGQPGLHRTARATYILCLKNKQHKRKTHIFILFMTIVCAHAIAVSSSGLILHACSSMCTHNRIKMWVFLSISYMLNYLDHIHPNPPRHSPTNPLLSCSFPILGNHGVQLVLLTDDTQVLGR